MKPKPVLAAASWPTNAELIADAARLGYLKPTDHVLDPTFGGGTWWKVWKPDRLTALNREQDGSDFRKLDYPDATFDAVAFDPPYVCPGGRATSGIKTMHDAYGMNERTEHDDPSFRTPAELQEIIDAGLSEMARLVRPARTKKDGGIILVKCKNYIWSAAFWPGAHYTWEHAMSIGLVQVDEFHHGGTPGPQPPRTRADGTESLQQHARTNVSTLYVFRRPK